jgi:hypothetical protein
MENSFVPVAKGRKLGADMVVCRPAGSLRTGNLISAVVFKNEYNKRSTAFQNGFEMPSCFWLAVLTSNDSWTGGFLDWRVACLRFIALPDSYPL